MLAWERPPRENVLLEAQVPVRTGREIHRARNMLLVRDYAENMLRACNYADFQGQRDIMPKKVLASSGHPNMQLAKIGKNVVCSLERGGMTVPVFRPAIPSLHPALTFRCSVASLARCTNF